MRLRRASPADMGLVEAIRLAAEQGCELEAAGEGRYLIRAIAYDTAPYELDQSRLLGVSAAEFIA